MYNVLTATNYPIINKGLSHIVQKVIPDEVNLSSATSFSEMTDILAKVDTQMAILDLQLLETEFPVWIDMEMLEKFVKDRPLLKIIVVYEKMHLPFFRWIYLNGIMGVLAKSAAVTAIETCIQSVYRSDIYISNDLLVDLIKEPFSNMRTEGKRFTGKGLTEREKLIAGLLAQGKTGLHISTLLGLHQSTVATYKKRVFSKLHVANVIELEKLIGVVV